jgi:presqualene diphosphate synthase
MQDARALALSEAAETAPAQHAAGSSFYNAMRILPRAQREGMFAIYSFCRQVDDIADSKETRETRRAQLGHWREEIDALYAGTSSPRTQALVAPIREFGLRREDFHSIIDGMEMDVVADIQAPDEATLELYCDRVASAVGRLSVRIFGMDESDGLLLAHHLGRALQLTNILRDLDEDAAIGRLYLPGELLHEAGIDAADPAAVLASPALERACTAIVARARGHFAQAEHVMQRSPRRTVRAPHIMADAYCVILDRLVERGWSPPRRPIQIPRTRLLWIIMHRAFI